jgi:hypothetical protein
MKTTIKKVRLTFKKLKTETPQAILILVNGNEYWLPKRLCKNFVLNNKLGGHLDIPNWLYEKNFGQLENIEQASEIQEYHIPEIIEVKQIEVNGNLIR